MHVIVFIAILLARRANIRNCRRCVCGNPEHAADFFTFRPGKGQRSWLDAHNVVLSGLLGAAMIATGLVLWAVKRRQRAEKARSGIHSGLRLVERLNIGAIVGLPVAIGAYFWANRLLPIELAARAQWEAHVLFIVWTLMRLKSLPRLPQRRRTLCANRAALNATLLLCECELTIRYRPSRKWLERRRLILIPVRYRHPMAPVLHLDPK
jgi:hypothetical protein